MYQTTHPPNCHLSLCCLLKKQHPLSGRLKSFLEDTLTHTRRQASQFPSYRNCCCCCCCQANKQSMFDFVPYGASSRTFMCVCVFGRENAGKPEDDKQHHPVAAVLCTVFLASAQVLTKHLYGNSRRTSHTDTHTQTGRMCLCSVPRDNEKKDHRNVWGKTKKLG